MNGQYPPSTLQAFPMMPTCTMNDCVYATTWQFATEDCARCLCDLTWLLNDFPLPACLGARKCFSSVVWSAHCKILNFGAPLCSSAAPTEFNNWSPWPLMQMTFTLAFSARFAAIRANVPWGTLGAFDVPRSNPSSSVMERWRSSSLNFSRDMYELG